MSLLERRLRKLIRQLTTHNSQLATPRFFDNLGGLLSIQLTRLNVISFLHIPIFLKLFSFCRSSNHVPLNHLCWISSPGCVSQHSCTCWLSSSGSMLGNPRPSSGFTKYYQCTDPDVKSPGWVDS